MTTRRRKQQKRLDQWWTDHAGKRWRVPNIRDRLRVHQITGHAALKAHVICRDGGVCRRCGSIEDLVLDHIVSRRNGGTHHPDNLQALCKICNDAKSNYEDRGREAPSCGATYSRFACMRTRGHAGDHVFDAVPQ